MRALLLVLAVVLVAPASACRSHDEASAPQIVPGAPAGDVTELSGDVKATRDGKPRALAKGDVVSGDDVIATGADGRVTIVLAHNQVAWSLGPNKEKKVGDSAAWAAAKGASPESVSDDKSGAAGRHAERSAADTVSTSGGGSGSAVAAGSGSADQERLDEMQRELSSAKDEQMRRELEEQLAKAEQEKRKLGDHAPPKGSGSAHTKCEPGDPLCVDDDVRAPGGGGEVEGSIDKDQIRRVFQAHGGDFRRCFEKLLETAPSASGKIRLRITIGTSGKVTQAVVDGDDPLAPMFDCVKTAAGKLVFPKPGGEITVSYPLLFSAAP